MSESVIYGMSSAEYHAVPALSATGLKHLSRSPAHFHAAVLDPFRPLSMPSAAMRAGTMAHTALLEPDEFERRYRIQPAHVDGRTTVGKAWIAAAQQEGVEVITEDEAITAHRQAEAVRALPEIAALLDKGHAETSAFWTDEETGVLCKCRPDFCSPVGKGKDCVLLDLKTTKSAHPRDFARSIAEYRYHGAAAHYSDGWEKASGMPVVGFCIVAVESIWPHMACAYMIDDDGMALARRENRRLTQLYSECLRSNNWPGYAETIQPISLPSWYKE